jgi:hypothetical protein
MRKCFGFLAAVVLTGAMAGVARADQPFEFTAPADHASVTFPFTVSGTIPNAANNAYVRVWFKVYGFD